MESEMKFPGHTLGWRSPAAAHPTDGWWEGGHPANELLHDCPYAVEGQRPQTADGEQIKNKTAFDMEK